MIMRLLGVLVCAALAAGCASVPTASVERALETKRFSPPSDGMAGLYIFRDSYFGGAWKRKIFVDDKCLGQSAPMVYFYKEVTGDAYHHIESEGEFSPFSISLQTDSGRNYFVRQSLVVGLFEPSSRLEEVDAVTGKNAVLGLELAVNGMCPNY